MSNVDSGNGFGTRVFWIAVIPDGDVRVNPAAGKATLDVSNLAVVNYYSPTGYAGNISLGPNWQTAGVDASVSFHVAWDDPVTRKVNLKDAADGFAGIFNEVNNNNVTVSWSGSTASGFSFTSNVGNLATSTALAPGNFFAQLAQERNGIFFPAGSSPALAGGASGAAALGQALATLAVPGENRALQPAAVDAALGGAGLAPGNSPGAAGTAAWQPLPLGGLDNGSVGDLSEQPLGLAAVARDHAPALAADPAAFAVFPEAGP